MKILPIADIHLCKKLFDIKVNPYLSITKQELNDIWSNAALVYLREVIDQQNVDEQLLILFLGDLLDTPYITLPRMDGLISLFDYILDKSDKWNIDVMVGNHDCSSRIQNWNKTPLRYLCDYDSRLSVIIDKKTIELPNNEVIVYMPYKKRKEVLPFAYKLRHVTQGKRVYLFSHNNIYITPSFRDTEMIPTYDIKEAFAAASLFTINGHIHHKHYEVDFFQPGSVNPTSFKYNPTASGAFLYDFNTSQHTQYKNRSVVYLAVNNFYYLDTLKGILDNAVKFKAVVFLKYPALLEPDLKPILAKYKTVIIGIKETTDT